MMTATLAADLRVESRAPNPRRAHLRAQVLLDALNEHTVDAGAGVDAVASFDNVNVMAPRGRFEVELYLSFLKLIGQVHMRPRLRPHNVPPGLPVMEQR